jgi:hypothetical protein
MASAAQQVSRNTAIRAARAAGEQVGALATRFDLSESRIKDILREVPPVTLPKDGAVKAVEERRADYRRLLDEARTFTTLIPETQPAAKVGGYRLQLDGLDRLTALEQKLGYLPADLAELGHKREFAQKVLDIFVEHDVCAEARQAVLSALEADAWVS